MTHTIDGTPIDLYGVNENHVLDPPYLLEATWNEKGALCILHARWLVLSPGCRAQFGHVLGQPYSSPESKDGKGKKGAPTHVLPKKVLHGHKGGSPDQSWTGTEYHCDPSQLAFLTENKGCEMDQALMERALRFGILADDSLLH